MRLRAVVGVVAVILVVGVTGLVAYLPLLHSEAVDPPILLLESVDPHPDLRPLADLPDLSQVDRSVVVPARLTHPRFCLLVFGPEAKTRVWLIEDGETLYIDRNANGDLTDPGEVATFQKRSEFSEPDEHGQDHPYREWSCSVGDLTPADGSKKHTGLELTRYQSGDKSSRYVLFVHVGGILPQYAGWGPIFASSRETAPVIHFGGAVVPKLLRDSAVHVSRSHDKLAVCIGTPGLGNNSFAFVDIEAVPKNIRPVVEIAWPTKGPVRTERFALPGRC